ncbi:MAG: DUF354 domain-containing protein [Candidatus Kariarchaeaceae archaeon]
MLLWFDALTPKQALILDSIARFFEKKGHKTLFTTRSYDYTISTLDRLKREYIIIGKHGGGDLGQKLIRSTERMSKLTEYILGLPEEPSLLVSLSSPDANRVAFGLAIHSICLNDAPHAVAVGKLCFSLATKLVITEAISPEKYLSLGATQEKIVQFSGIDEVGWLKDFKPDKKVLTDLGITETDQLAVLRTEESNASYYRSYLKKEGLSVDQTPLISLIRAILDDFDLKLVVFPRYDKQKAQLEEEFGSKIIIPPKSIDTQSLMSFADLVVTGGGTMGREAALLGTPTICFFPKYLDVEAYLSKIGLPLFHLSDFSEVIPKGLEILASTDYKQKTEAIINGMEAPLDGVIKALRGTNLEYLLK